MPTSDRDFLHAGEQRLSTAEFLIMNKGNTLDAYYLTGYAIECSLKALILFLTPEELKSSQLVRITSGAAMHRYDTLLGILRESGVVLPLDIAKRFRRFPWSTTLRYETGRKPTGEANGFIKTAILTGKWVKEQIS